MAVAVATVQVAANTSIGDQDITTSKLGGLTPVAALLSITPATSNGSPVDDVQWTIAVTDGSLSEAFCFNSDHGVGTSDTAKQYTEDPLMIANATDQTVEARGTFVTWITNGIRVNWGSGEVPSGAFLVNATFFAGDVTADVGYVAAPTSVEGTVDITTIGFEPDIVFGFYVLGIQGGSDNNGGHIRSSFGVAYNTGASVVQRSIGWQDRNGVLTTDCRSNLSETYFCRTVANSGASYEMALNAEDFDSSGFTIRAKDGARSDSDFLWLALKLDGVAGISLHTHDTKSSTTGEKSDTTPGFTPQALIIGMTMAEAVDTIDTGDTIGGSLGLAFSDSSDMYSTSLASDSGLGSSDTQSLVDNSANLPNEDGSAGVEATIPGGGIFDANGYTLDYTAVETNAKKWWVLAIEESATCPDVDIQDGTGKLASCSDIDSVARAIAWTNSTSDVEATHRFRFNETSSEGTQRVFIRGSGDWASAYTPTQAYELAIASDGGYVINRIEAGGRTQIGTGAWTADTNWWQIKFQAEGTQIRFKIWQDGVGEPTAWNEDINDSVSGFTDAGDLQLALQTSVAGATHTLFIDDVSYNVPTTAVADSKSAYMLSGGIGSDSKSAYIEGAGIPASDNSSAYIAGTATASDAKEAYIQGTLDTSDSKSAYVVGSVDAAGSNEAYIQGALDTSDSKSAYIQGTLDTADSKSAYIQGTLGATSNKGAYVAGSVDVADSNEAYIQGQDTSSGSTSAYIVGGELVETLVDTFNDNSRDTGLWDLGSVSLGGDNPSVTVDEQNLQLEIQPLDSVAGNNFYGYKSVDTFVFVNSSITLEMPLVDNTGGGLNVGVSLQNDPVDGDNRLGIEVETLIYWKYRGTSNNSTSMTYNSTDHRWWRIRWTSANILWETSPNGVTWTTRRTVAVSTIEAAGIDLTNMRVYLHAGTYASKASPGPTHYDNINIVQDDDGREAYIAGTDTASDSNEAYVAGTDIASDSTEAYVAGSVSVTDSAGAYIEGAGVPASDNKEAYIAGTDTAGDSNEAYIQGQDTSSDSKSAYLIGGVKVENLADDFNDNSRDTGKWDLGSHDTAADDPAVTTDEANGRLEIQIPDNDTGYYGFKSVNQYSLIDSTALVEAKQVPTGFAAGNFNFILQAGSTDALNLIAFYVNGATPNLKLAYRNSGSWIENSIAYDSVAHRWLQFRHDLATDNILWETSPNGITWTTRRTLSRSTLAFDIGALRVHMDSGSWGNITSVQQTQLDNLNIVQADDNAPAYIAGQVLTSDSKAAYINGASAGTDVDSRISAYIAGTDVAADNKEAYIAGTDVASDSSEAYIQGQDTSIGSTLAYIAGTDTASDSNEAYIQGKLGATDSKGAYIQGVQGATDSKEAYVAGGVSVASNAEAYIQGTLGATDSKSAYIQGVQGATDNKAAYIAGSLAASDASDAYIAGGLADASSKQAYMAGTAGTSARASAFIQGLTFFPVTEPWTGANDDEWRRSHWVTETS